jgi:hypothetical protein
MCWSLLISLHYELFEAVFQLNHDQFGLDDTCAVEVEQTSTVEQRIETVHSTQP